jgi:hypothetical protein
MDGSAGRSRRPRPGIRDRLSEQSSGDAASTMVLVDHDILDVTAEPAEVAIAGP